MERVILHCDMNNFFASVECCVTPSLKGKPVMVCGDKELRHGIVLAKNDIAKKTGVKTGEPIFKAKEKCPNAVIVPPHFEFYKFFSEQAMRIYCEYTDLCEPFSIDECYLDITESRKLFGDAEKIAREIRERIRRELGITVSVGISYNKYFAKMGSDYKKPDAQTLITKDNFQKLLWPCPIEDMLFVGKKSSVLLRDIGIDTMGKFAALSHEDAHSILGKNGVWLNMMANGLDDEPVIPYTVHYVPKSISNGTTPPYDMVCADDVKIVLISLAQEVSRRLKEEHLKCRTVTLRVRDPEFHDSSHQLKMNTATDLWHDLYLAGFKIWENRFSNIGAIREITLHTTDFVCGCDENIQIDFENGREERIRKLELSVQNIRDRYGYDSILPCISLKKSGC